MPENAAVVATDPLMTLEFHAISVGGIRFGQAQSSCDGVQFYLNQQNLVQYFSASIVKNLPSLITARFFHQAVIIKVKNSWTLFVAGGKTKERWLASTEKLDLTPYFKKGLTVLKDGIVEKFTSEWVEAKPMLSARSNFAMVVQKDSVYAIGGISDKDAMESHRPVLSHPVEMYNVNTDKWEQLSIANFSRLAAFSWTPLGDSSSVAILGGSNGNIMQDELIIVDLKKEAAENFPAAYPFFTAMGHLTYHEEEKTLYSFGGLNSQGINYKLRLDAKDWEQ